MLKDFMISIIKDKVIEIVARVENGESFKAHCVAELIYKALVTELNLYALSKTGVIKLKGENND